MAINLPLDSKLNASIQRRRIAEEQRKARIFNPRQRLIGIDVDALDSQVHHANLLKCLERQKDEEFALYAKRCDRNAILLEKQEEAQVRSLNQAIDHFRITEQRPLDRRDFDLYDPDLKKKEMPARVSDDDPRCSLSGVQKLEGEDLGFKERTKTQRQQNCQWLMQQIAEKRMKQDEQNAKMQEAELRLQELDNHAVQLAEMEKKYNKKIAEDVNLFNLHLAQDKKAKAKQQQLTDEMDKLSDIYGTFYGDFLSENPDVARSSFGAHRIVPDRWKGMSKDELMRYFQDQRKQIVENRRRKEHELEDKMRWDHMVMSQARQAELLERDEMRKQRDIQKELLRLNKELSQDQKQQQRYLNNVVYANAPTEEYFSQFNTTTR